MISSARLLIERNVREEGDGYRWRSDQRLRLDSPAFLTEPQVLACLAAWQDPDFCRDVLGLDAAFGTIGHDRLNVDGGAIALGHPVGTSGNRIVLHLANAMRRLETKHGIATECIGGGLGGAMLLEAA